MTALNAPTTADVGNAAAKQRSALARQNAGNGEFESALAESALSTCPKRAQASTKSDREGADPEATTVGEPLKHPLHSAWPKIVNSDEGEGAECCEEPHVATSDAERTKVNATQDAGASASVWPLTEGRAVQQDGKADEAHPASLDWLKSLRIRPLKAGLSAADGDADSPLHLSRAELPPIKFVGEETHFPAPNRGHAKAHIEGQESNGAKEASPDHKPPRVARKGGAEQSVEPIGASVGGTSRASQSSMNATATPDLPIVSAPAMQVLERLIADAEPASAQAATPAQTTPIDDKTHQSSVVRTIRLQLAPESLGLVNVVVTRGDTSLRIRLEAEIGETQGILSEDKDAIGRQLEARGLRVDEVVVIRMNDADTSSTSPARSSIATQEGESNMGSRSQDGQSRQSSRHAEPDQGGSSRSEAENAEIDRQRITENERFLGRRTIRSV